MRTIFEIQVAGGACSLIVFYNCKSVIKLNPGFYLSENELYWIVCGRWKTLMIITFLILPKQKFTGATGRAFLFKKVWVFFIINLPRPRPPPSLNWRRFTREMSEFWSQNFLIPFFMNIFCPESVHVRSSNLFSIHGYYYIQSFICCFISLTNDRQKTKIKFTVHQIYQALEICTRGIEW